MIHAGKAIKFLRSSMELTQRAMAEQLKISHVHLCNIENDKAKISINLIEKFHQIYGVDLYIYSWSMKQMSGPFSKAALILCKTWREYIERGCTWN